MITTKIAIGALLVISVSANVFAEELTVQQERVSDLLGTDSNSDGVRDDIEAYLNTEYSGYPILRAELKSYSVAINSLMTAKTLKQRLQAYDVMDAAKYCVIGWGYSEEEFADHVAELYKHQLDNTDRKLAANMAEQSMVGFERGNMRDKTYRDYCVTAEEK